MENKIQTEIFKELTEILYRNLSLGLLGILIQAGIILWLLFGYVDTTYLLIWYTILTLNLLGGYLVIGWYRRTQNNLKLLNQHYYAYIIGSSVTAVMLGMLGSILMPADIPHQALVMIAIIGITGASVQNLHASYLASGCFLVFSLLPLLIWELIQALTAHPIYIGILVVTLTYCLYLAVDVRTGYTTLVNNIKLKLENIHLSLHDSLTGLYNRHYLTEMLHNILAAAKRNHSKVSFILFDIDHFKNINDEFGHDAGDLVLCRVSKLIKNFFRETDLAFRYGGEEFLLISIDSSNQKMTKRANEFREYIQQSPVKINPQTTITLTISGGVASYPDQGHSGDALITAADKALYQAKRDGRNLVYSAQSTKAESINS